MSPLGPPAVFNYGQRSLRTALIKGDDIWVVRSEVCQILGIANSSQAVARLASYEKGVITVDTLGGQQEVGIISESGLYKLIMTSRKPEAQAFQQWVTGEVLPSIRKTGRYEHVTPRPQLQQEDPLPEGACRVVVPRGDFLISNGPAGVTIRDADDVIVDDAAAVASRYILANQVMVIAALWRQYRIMSALVFTVRDHRYLSRATHEVIQEARRIASRYLDGPDGCQPFEDGAPQG